MKYLLTIFTLWGVCAASVRGDDLEQSRREMIDWGVRYLKAAQGQDGLFSPDTGIGPTTVVLIGLLRCGAASSDTAVVNALEALLAHIGSDGGIYTPGGRIAAYESALAISALKLAVDSGADARFSEPLARAEEFLRSLQYGDANGTDVSDLYYGGVGYGAMSRPDLSCTQYFIDALHDMGAGADDPALQSALVFVSRCQNFDSGETVSGAADSKENDGGFIYTCVGEGQSPAGKTDAGLRSYGSITYAGLKSLIYAGLTPDDPRVTAASEWLKKNYSLDENPGLGRRGLYYYYHTMAKTLALLGEKTVTDSSGTEHDWRRELIETLAEAQRPDGSWVNDHRMWMETDPVLVTGYALIVLSYCGGEE